MKNKITMQINQIVAMDSDSGSTNRIVLIG